MRWYGLLLGVWMFLAGVYAQVLESSYPAMSAHSLEIALLAETNKARADYKLEPLRHDEALAQAARAHAREMLERNYFSHQSPVAANETPLLRVANAGSSLSYVGENIAKMPAEASAADTLAGWLNSPGHRQNLLEPDYSHVGFGVAQAAQGFIYIVQVLGHQPFALVAAEVTGRSADVYTLSFNAKSTADTSAIFSYGTEQSGPRPLKAGDNALALTTLAKGQLYLQASVLAASGGGYIIQDGGWVDLDSLSYQADALAARTIVQLESLSIDAQTQVIADLMLLFDGAAGRDLAVFVDDQFTTKLDSGTLRLSLPRAGLTTIAVGEMLDNNRVRIVHQLHLDTSLGQPRLLAGP